MRILISKNEDVELDLIKPEITQQEVIKLMELMDIPNGAATDEGPAATEISTTDNIDKEEVKEDRAELERKRSRQLPLTNTSESEGFALSESFRVTGKDRVQAEIKCPDCGAVTVDSVPAFFNHMKCNECGLKVFLVPVSRNDDNTKDERGNSKVGSSQYFTREERAKFKNEVKAPETEEEILNDFTRNVIKEAMNEFTVVEIQQAAYDKGFRGHRYLKKAELIDYVINHGGYVEDDIIKFKD